MVFTLDNAFFYSISFCCFLKGGLSLVHLESLPTLACASCYPLTVSSLCYPCVVTSHPLLSPQSSFSALAIPPLCFKEVQLDWFLISRSPDLFLSISFIFQMGLFFQYSTLTLPELHPLTILPSTMFPHLNPQLPVLLPLNFYYKPPTLNHNIRYIQTNSALLFPARHSIHLIEFLPSLTFSYEKPTCSPCLITKYIKLYQFK